MKRASCPICVNTECDGSTILTGNQLRQELPRWLSPPNPSINHNIACGAHHKRNAEWFSKEVSSRQRRSKHIGYLREKEMDAPGSRLRSEGFKLAPTRVKRARDTRDFRAQAKLSRQVMQSKPVKKCVPGKSSKGKRLPCEVPPVVCELHPLLTLTLMLRTGKIF